MGKFIVKVLRTSYASRNIEVEAETEEQANEKALEQSGDYEYSEYNADYEIEHTTEKEE